MVEYLSGERIQGSSTLASSPPQTSWKELDRVTLTSAGDTLDTGTFTAKDNIMILENKIPTGSCRSKYQFNGDDNDNYSQRYTDNGGSDGTFTADPVIYAYHSGGSAKSFSVHSIINNSSQEKLLIGNIVENGGDGSGNAPNRQELVGKWANTSAQINRVKLFNDGSGSFDTGSELVVLGCNNDEADSGTNFWQELASVSTSSSGSELSSGTFTAKKYLMFDAYMVGSAAQPRSVLRFNGSTASDYSARYSNNGGSDGNDTDTDEIYLSESDQEYGSFTKGFIVNKSDQEKLVIAHNGNAQNGAGNAPNRFEVVGKWDKTDQTITSIQLRTHANTFSYAFLKVWGAD